MAVTSLPIDVLIAILAFLAVPDLANLARSSRFFRDFVDHYGWSGYLQANPRPSYSLTKARALSSPRASAYYNARTDIAWIRRKFIARPLSNPWNEKVLPVLAINPSRLVVAAGDSIYSYTFPTSRQEHESPPVIREGQCKLSPRARRDITAMTFAADNNLDHTLYIGYQDGSLERATIEPSMNSFSIDHHSVGQCSDLVRSLSSSRNCLLSLTASGHATLSLTDRGLTPLSSIELNTRGWASYLCLDAPCPYAAFGTSSTTPLTVHAISEDGLRTQPTAILQPKSKLPNASSAVYGITQAPTCSPWGSSPQILVSGWFDGLIRCFDLRSPLRSSDMGQSSSGCVPLKPVLSLYDPFSDESVYSRPVTARHSVVSFWDIRALKKSWSVHAPGNDPSPVYSIVLESSRLFGVTQSRPFVYDFGPGVTTNTYPKLRMENRNNPSFYVTTYAHRTD
ncbi:hypothetical protein F5887DRAFT_1059607 [Amanita rubescens]|nr:hypothetical protein F5887DRAFT_1059607 [Amanita rubescens]